MDTKKTYRGKVIRVKQVATYNLLYLENVVDNNGKEVMKEFVTKADLRKNIKEGDEIHFHPTSIKIINKNIKDVKTNIYMVFRNKKEIKWV